MQKSVRKRVVSTPLRLMVEKVGPNNNPPPSCWAQSGMVKITIVNRIKKRLFTMCYFLCKSNNFLIFAAIKSKLMASQLFGAIVKAAAELKNIPVQIKQKNLKPIKAQERELKKLLRKAQFTEFGKTYHFTDILLSGNVTEAFRNNVPVFDYNKMHDQWWYRALEGEHNVSWPGKIKYFALSSGTSEASSKYIPITRELNSKITKASIRQLVSAVRYDFPKEFYNRGVLMIGGSTDLSYSRKGGYYAGDLSGISAGRIPKWFEFFYKPGQRISKIKDWSEKLDEMVKAAPTWDIGVIVGVPAWVQILLERIIKEYNLKTIHDLWPNLMVYVHSGVAFAPYEKSFERLFGKEVIYIESYLASEGYIAYQVDLKRRVMQLLVDNGIYFEFVPFNEENFDDNGNIVEHPKTLNLKEVEENVDYALLLSTCAGTWRYLIGDTIKFLNKEHCDIVITGRTKQFLSITGEHLSQDNMTQAVDMLANELGVEITEFTVAGIKHETMYAHHWYLGTDDKIDPQEAIKKIDGYLCKLNDDYAVERTEAIKELFIDVLPTEVFYKFMEEKIGKWGGATKFPRVLKGQRYEMWEEYLKEVRSKQ